MTKDSWKRVTVKLGTSVVSDSQGRLRLEVLSRIVEDLSQAARDGVEILLVSSGAVGLGRQALSLQSSVSKESLAQKQACAAVGQSLLIQAYQELFSSHGYAVAQILVTAEDLAQRQRYLNLRETLNELLKLKVIPILNENDSVSTMEIQPLVGGKAFGDNDKLSALVASKLEANALLLLTNVDGIYREQPKEGVVSHPIPLIQDLSVLSELELQGTSQGGRGGMLAKTEAIRLASMSGLHTVVARGDLPGVVRSFLKVGRGEAVGFPCTTIEPTRQLRGRTHWIGFSSGIEGVLVINEGAQQALEEKKSSLLPVGVLEVRGSFAAGEVVSVQNTVGVEVARGVTELSSAEAGQRIGVRSEDWRSGRSENFVEEVIHRDKMAVFQEKRRVWKKNQ